MQTVKSFAQQTLEKLGQDPVDYLLLNAAIARNADDRPGPNGSQWCDSYIINHLCEFLDFNCSLVPGCCFDADVMFSAALSDASAAIEA